MSIRANIPEIIVLKHRVEEVFGDSLQTHNAFISLADRIERALREHVSESTLERLWGYSTRGADAISVRTLDVLARYCGAANWKAFADDLSDSEEFPREGISADSLQPGDRLRLGWLPNRLVTIQLCKDGRFAVVTSLNSSLRHGDSFTCQWFQLGRPLYLDHFRRNGSIEEARYVAGETSGLTTLEWVED
ncbi:MAG: hypothetical protein IK008_05320 [Bacteroidales bacterium]|nr:hypothetical protein [Bacteroidales bacterium]